MTNLAQTITTLMLLLTPVTAAVPGAEERLVDVMDPLSVALGTLL
ncbi:MAG: hypothetical protein QF415_01195 [Candidatus Undinarchaeales archaeon]|jgi:hypothetical protein|nr:hypothetical protein [Candidatus Undinarchaeales archaeon]